MRAALSLRARLPQRDWEGVPPGTVRVAAFDALPYRSSTFDGGVLLGSARARPGPRFARERILSLAPAQFRRSSRGGQYLPTGNRGPLVLTEFCAVQASVEGIGPGGGPTSSPCALRRGTGSSRPPGGAQRRRRSRESRGASIRARARSPRSSPSAGPT